MSYLGRVRPLLVAVVLGFALSACARDRSATGTTPPPVAPRPAPPPTVIRCGDTSALAAAGGASSPDTRIDVYGWVDDPERAAPLAAALCPRVEEARRCIRATRRGQPALRGTLDVELDTTLAGDVMPVAITGGSIHESRLRVCVVDALEITKIEPGEHVARFRLEIVSPALPAAPPSNGAEASERLPPETIRQLIRAHFPRFRACYMQGLQLDPKLTGDVMVEFVIELTGRVSDSRIVEADSTLQDPAVRECVRKGYEKIWFPEPVGGEVKVTYPINFASKDAP